MRRIILLSALTLILVIVALPALAALQSSSATAEAIGQANLRGLPDINGTLVGQIFAGTQYPIIGRSEFYPWLLLGDPVSQQPVGWVFDQLVTVRGELSQVPFSNMEVQEGMTLPIATPSSSPLPEVSADIPSATPVAPPTSTLAADVTGTVLGEINIRYGPGVEYPRVGIGEAGDQFEILTWHTQLPWVEIAYDAAPGGRAWVAVDLLEIQGDLHSLPSTSRTQFNLPTLTPTLSVVERSAMIGGTPVPVSPAFQALGDQLYQMMLDAQFEEGTSRLGALFLLDLQTGEAISFGEDIAFSGMSLNKIPILAALYGRMTSPPDIAEANTIAESIICSENISTNELLAAVGDGNPFTGTERVTEFMHTLGLENTFITAPYGNDPFITQQPVSAPMTTADQRSAEPDPFNQATVNELGSLLADIYQCAYRGDGPLMDLFPGQYTQQECHQMLHALNNNRINALFESGLPEGTNISHKHGWIDDTHGDAAIIYTPGGDYVLVAIVHNPVWMDYSESFPLFGEISRAVYNYYNPNSPVAEIRPGDGAEQCHLLGNPLIEDLTSSTFEGL